MSDKEYPIGLFTSEFTGNEPYLDDHIINGRKILPGVVYLEMSRAAIDLSFSLNEDQIVVLSDSLFMQPMIVQKKISVNVKVYPGSSGEFGVEVETEQGIHFQSKAYIKDLKEDIAESNNLLKIDIDSLKKECIKKGPDGKQFYKNFKNKGINLGPSLRGIQSIEKGVKCALVHVLLPEASKQGMNLIPGVFDSFIQSGDVLADDPDIVRVPFAVKQTKVYGSLSDEMFGFIEKTEEGVNYTIADVNGNIKIKINDFMGREMGGTQDELCYYQPSWEEKKEDQLEKSPDKIKKIIEPGKNYNETLINILETVKEIKESDIENHILELNLPTEKELWKGIYSALKTVGLEFPKISYQMKVNDKFFDIKYKNTKLNSTEIYDWPDQKNILITGGLGGLGKIIAEDIATQSGKNKLILVGRSKLDSKKQEFINKLKSLNTQVEYRECDISNYNDVKSLFEEFQDINGIIHGAGTNQDSLVSEKNIDEIEKVLAPKVAGIKILDEVSSNTKLDYFIVLSSIAGTLGNVGQIDYAAANGYMDSYITDRAKKVENGLRFGKSLSINWPLWESGGMQIDDFTKKNLQQVFKVKPLPTSIGLKALKRTIKSEFSQLVVMYGNSKAISGMMIKKEEKKEKLIKKVANSEIEKLTKEVLLEVRELTAKHLKLQINQLNDTTDWAVFGFDSILLSSFANKINTHFNINIMPSIFFEATNMQLFSEYLVQDYPEQMSNKMSVENEDVNENTNEDVQEVVEEKESDVNDFVNNLKRSYKSSVTYREQDVAIVGMSCRIAGARNLDEFWKMLDEEKDMISEIPSDRWDWRDYPGVSKWGSFIDGAAEFDPLFFGISPIEAMYMVPEQRLMLQYVWECLENAGCCGEDIKGNNTGLFIGCGPSGYSYFMRNSEINAYTNTGYVPSVGPNRISFLLDWHGPSNPIDTACSSALVAVHRAVEAIHLGHCDQAVVGGVNMLLSPDPYIGFSKAGMLCEDGKCKTFSNKANGYVRGEGIGLLMLKPLKKAIKDGNKIYALVKGTAENHGGHTNSLTAPNPRSQAEVIKKAFKESGIDFSRVGYIECHGTGTSLGDPVEIRGLKTVASELLENKEPKGKCKLGSIKSNIGHLEYGAGVVGIIKAVLQIQNKKIAKSLHCDEINPYIDLKDSPFEIAQEASEWEVGSGQTRVAGVSSFGFGGVNSHIVLEEYNESHSIEEKSNINKMNETNLLILSAQNEERLLEYVKQFPEYLKKMDVSNSILKEIAYTLQTGRMEMPERVAFVVQSIDECIELMETFGKDNGDTFDRRIFKGSVNEQQSSGIELGDTGAGKDFVTQLIKSSEFGKIAELWTKGTKIDWDQMYN